jgi:hypothetical protein
MQRLINLLTFFVAASSFILASMLPSFVLARPVAVIFGVLVVLALLST